MNRVHKINWLFFLNNRGEADGEGKEDDTHKAGDVVSKADLDAAVARADKAEKDLEGMRLEVLSDEYLDYLNTKDKKPAPDKKEEKTPEPDDFEKLTKKELYERAVKAAKEDILGKIEKEKEDARANSEADTKRRIAVFAKEHSDYETYRPIMYGLSLDPKYRDASLQTLYDDAKKYTKRVSGEMTEEEKKKLKAATGMKPGGDNSSFSKEDKNKSVEQLTNEAMDEVEQSLGPIPSA